MAGENSDYALLYFPQFTYDCAALGSEETDDWSDKMLDKLLK